MNLSPGMIVVVAAALLFYLRLILIQRQHAKQIAQARAAYYTKKPKSKSQPASPPPRYSIISQNPRDLILAGVGSLLVIIGLVLNAGALPLYSLQQFWWIPTTLGILAFSFGFR